MAIVKGEGQVLTPQDFDAIREAVMETPRGRWFLSEYASRLRTAETAGMLESMKKLEQAVVSNHDALMSRLAQAIAREPSSAPAAAAAPQADLAPKHMKFFKQDEEIFEPAPQAKIAAVPETPKPEPRPESPKGARVVIRRGTEAPAAEAPQAVAQPSPPPAPAAEPVAAAPAAEAQAEAAPKRRIVIIRHKPGEEIDVPLQNEMAEAS